MNDLVINEQNIQNKIYTVRGMQVMLDRDLATLYGVETKVFNQAVKRNIDRFPSDFMFQLSTEEFENWRSQFVTSNSDKMGLRRPPYAFSEQGVSMLSAILKSQTAITVSVEIIRTFVKMRKIISSNSLIFERFERIEHKLSLHDKNFDKIFNAIEDKTIKPKQGIFYDGQTFDAYVFVADIIKSAKSSIMLLSKRVSTCKATIYTKSISKQLQLDLKKHNEQYLHVEVKKFNASHDRFLIIDDKEVYHIGASLKDLGKKWFAFSKMDSESLSIFGKLK